MRVGDHCTGMYLPLPALAGWSEDSGELDRPSTASLAAPGTAMPASSLFPCSSSPQPHRSRLVQCVAHGPAAEQPAKGTVAARLVSLLAVACRGLAGQRPGTEVSYLRGRRALSYGSRCFPVGKQCIFSLKSLPSEGLPRTSQAAGGRRCSAVARCRGDAASLDFPSESSLGLGLPVVLLQNNLTKPGARKAAGTGSGRSALSPPLLPWVMAGRTWRNNPLGLLGVAVVPAETAGCTGLSHRLAGLVSAESCHRSVILVVGIWGHLPAVTQGAQVGSPALQPSGVQATLAASPGAAGMGWECQKPWHSSRAGSCLPYRQ